MTPDRTGEVPEGIVALLFDLDGVLTQTAKVHAAAWKEMFDAFLAERTATGEPFSPADYAAHVDGSCARTACGRSSPRAGSRCRGRAGRPAGRGDRARPREPQERPGARADRARRRRALRGLGRVRRGGASGGLRPPSCRRARTAGRCSTPPASRSCSRCASTAWWRRERNLRGKPAPDMFLAAADALGVAPAARGGLRGRRRRASRPAGPAGSAGSSASTASGQRRRAARRTAPTSSSAT